MRKLTFGVANSLDNYIAREDHAVDWLSWSDEVGAIMSAYWKTIDAVLFGRKTYEISMKNVKGGGGNSKIKTYVFSRTLKESPGKRVEIISENAESFVQNLKNQEGKDICLMGGGNLAKSLFEAGLIDEVGVNIHPVLLGSGVPLFLEMNKQVDLELISSQTLKNGCMYLLYRVKK